MPLFRIGGIGLCVNSLSQKVCELLTAISESGSAAHALQRIYLAFSRPVRDVVCECAREEDPSLPQVLHMLNNAGVLAKVRSEKGRVAGWLKEGKTADEVVERIYLATLSRRPTEKERSLVKKHLATVPDRAAGLQDVQHALLNLNEFLLRH